MGDEETEHRQDVQVAHRVELIGPDEGQGEDERHRSPHPPVVRLFAVSPGVATGQLPADLIPGEDVVRSPTLGVDADLGYLRLFLSLLDPVVDDPLAVLVLRVRDVSAVLGDLFLHPWMGAGDLHRFLFIQGWVLQFVCVGGDRYAGDFARVVVHRETGNVFPGGLFRQNDLPGIRGGFVSRGRFDGRL